MCGIAGLWAPRLSREERLDRIEAMLDRVAHRGPSGRAAWADDRVALGLARLAIVAPTEPARLLEDERGVRRATVNGEIYNHDALRAWLLARGHRVAPGPDTALIPHLHEELGAGFPERLDGMFAAAVWDPERDTLVLARDRAGEKPLFYAEGAGEFAFASEAAALLVLPWVARDPDPGALSRYLVHGFFADGDSAFRGVRQLAPAHVLELRAGVARRTRYWRPWDALGRRRPESDPVGATRRALADAVRSRVPGEVPFGVFLSGGVDSSVVAALAAAAHPEPFPTFSLRLPARGYDESGYAREVARRIGSRHHELTFDVEAGEEALEAWGATMDQPLGDPSALPTWALARLASAHVPVVLTGEGGDELFAGYPTYLGHRWAGRVRRLPRGLRDAVRDAMGRVRPSHHHVTIPLLIERFLAAADLRPFERHLAWFGTASAAEARALLAPALRASLSEDDPLGYVDRVALELRGSPVGDLAHAPHLVAYQVLDFETYLGGGLLTKVDRCAMAHGLESRAPFLSHPLVELALGMPARLKLRGVTGKWVLKQAARGLIPDDVLARRKQGFSPPFSAWARGPLRDRVRARLAPERIARAGLLDPVAVANLLEAHLSSRAERGRALWAVLSLQMWAEHWVAGTPAADRARATAATPRA